MKIARQHGGAFLCDGVGLGKTFVGLMLIERLVLHEGKRVVLFAPKAAKEAVWEPHLREWLAPHRRRRRRGRLQQPRRLQPHRPRPQGRLPGAVRADHRARRRGDHRRGPPLPEPGQRGRDRRPVERVPLPQAVRPARPRGRDQKSVFLLTATPINNRLTDFRHMVELFSRRRRGVLRPHARHQQPDGALRQPREGRSASEFGDDDVTESESRRRGAGDPRRRATIVPGARRPAQPRLRAREPDPRDGQRGGVPRAQAAAGRRVLDPEDLRQAARRRRDGVRTKQAALHARRSTTRSPTTRGPTTSIDPLERTARSRSSG